MKVLKNYKNDFFFLFSNLLLPVFGFLGSIAVTKFLSPVELGIAQTVLLIPSYFFFLQIGVYSGLNRNIAFYQGKGDYNKVDRQIATSFRFSIYNSCIGALITSIFLICFLLGHLSSLYLLMLIPIFFYFVCSPFFTHFDTCLKSNQKFKEAGLSNLFDGFLNLSAAVSTSIIGFSGILLKTSSYYFFGTIYRFLFAKKAITLKCVFYRDEFKDLIKIGFPIMVAGFANQLNAVADKTVIATNLSARDVGLYSISALILIGFQSLPVAVSMLIYPRAARLYGETSSPFLLRKYVYLALIINLCCIVPTALLIHNYIDDIITLFLPKYIGGIQPAKVACYTAIAMSYLGCNVVFLVLKKNWVYIGGVLISTLLTWLFAKISINRRYGLEGIAWSNFISYIFLFAYVLCASLILTKRK